ncbi:hypothetical protein PBPRA1326 [Photobacterium profundum SS9]|uniref:Uncharacterized protein n=2 Tax=Photobacterium profundum TaxID=74109 RepID=Q6LSI9_PHOPR|nr:hypothetical protein PBPRA1326 [Photobacterium profundum SS9]
MRIHMNKNVQEKLYSFIVTNLPKEPLELLAQNIILKYGVVENFLEEELVVTPKARLRPQMRRYLIDEAFCTFGGEVCHTAPRGEHYIVNQFGDITLSHVEVPHGSKVRDATHRKLLSMNNALLEP